MMTLITSNNTMNLQVGVKVFLKNKEGRYLLLERNMDKYKGASGSWDIVGGRIDPGTTLEENLRREVREETQLEIVSEPKLIYAQDIIRAPEKHVVRLSYIADAGGDSVVLDTTENIAYKWSILGEMKELAGLDPFVKEIIVKGLVS